MKKVLLFILFILLLAPQCFGVLGDMELVIDGAKIIFNNNSQSFSIAASPSMSASVNYIWPVADGSAGQAIITNGSGVLSFTAPSTSFTHDILSVTHHDTVANAVTRGSLIYGNSTPKWDELTIGAANTFLKSDGTDAAWSTLSVSSPATLTGATIGWDSTLIDATTWSDGSNASNIWTFDVSGTDHTMTAGNGLMTFSNDVTAAGLTITNATVLGSDSAVFQPNSDSTTFFQVLDADGGTPIFNIDTTNERVGFGTASPTAPFDHVVNNPTANTMQTQNTAANGFVTLDLISSTGAIASTYGYSNASAGLFTGSTWFASRLLNSDLIFALQTTERMRLDASHGGRIVHTCANADSNSLQTQNTDATGYATLDLIASTGAIAGTYGYSNLDSGVFAGHIWFAARQANSDLLFATDNITERIRIKNSTGFLGINEIAPETLTEWTSADPHMTWHCSTHTDDDDARKTIFSFKGEQSGGEETTLARIEISHDGAADDEKGKIVISTNDGDDSDTPTDHVAIDAAGNTKIGDAGTTNYLNVDSGGRVLLVGTAQTWEDIRIVPGAFQFPGVADPTLESWQPGGAGATFKVYKFKINDEVHFTCQIPHNYKEGSDIKPHLHWTPGDRGNEEDGNAVGWKIDYSWANTDAAFASSTTVDLSDACSGIDDQHELTGSGTITGTNKAISGILQIRLYRSDTGADDTWVGATAALSPAILEFDLHYEIDSLGSDLELVKDAP